MTVLTSAERDLIARARELADLTGDQIRACADYTDPAMTYADILGRAQSVLAELAGLAERLGT